ncbi:hypothetical protein ACFWA5_27360 [Streptomyces mirabilis]|uniref:hypothetical protein n=1 Tax=Streptomyces mirabilis TaxID=68239 RepID=UPI0036691FE0
MSTQYGGDLVVPDGASGAGEADPVEPGEGVEPNALRAGQLTGPAESALRLVYGRNRPQDPLTATGSISLDDLRTLFPGF